MAGKKKRVCKRGHRMTLENTYKRKDGTRECRECSRLRSVEQKKAMATA
jgi:hypothetical protein